MTEQEQEMEQKAREIFDLQEQALYELALNNLSVEW